jgi:RecG-like helicase
MKHHPFFRGAALAAVTLALAFNAPAAEQEKEKTISGEGKCAKCALKETKSCQNALQVKENDKTVTYYLVHNDVSKKFHEQICTASKKITVTGTVKKVDNKLELTPKKIELAKEQQKAS